MRIDTISRSFSIPVKRRIAERDSIDGWPCCVYCGAAAPEELVWSNAHFISRSQAGIGDERNGLTLCPICHRNYDQTTARKKMREFFREYLMDHYDDWNEEELYYRKETHGR